MKLQEFLFNLKSFLSEIKCILGLHNYIYQFEENFPKRRYCSKCRRCEEYSDFTQSYLRIKDISYSEM